MNNEIMYSEQRAGFWIRLVAYLIDFVLLLIVMIPLILLAMTFFDYEENNIIFDLFYFLLVGIIYALFLYYKSATPGKMLLRLKVVDRETGGRLAMVQCLGRYLGYFVSGFILNLGFLWIAFTREKEGWHDMLADTIVIKTKKE